MDDNRSIDGTTYPPSQAPPSQTIISPAPVSSVPAPGVMGRPTAPVLQDIYAPTKTSHRLRWILLSLGVGMTIALVIGLFIATRRNSDAQVSSGEYATTQVPLGNIAASSLNNGAQTLKVNGDLQVSTSLILTPTTQPVRPLTGQLYYDKSSNQLAVYNGQQFQQLGTSTAATTTNITNVIGGTNTAAAPPGVLLQSTAPGAQQAGNFNIAGIGQVGTLQTTVISSNGGVLYVNPVSSTSQQQITPGTPATVGLTSGSLTSGSGWQNNVSASKVTLGSVGGTAVSISIHYTGGSPSSHVQVALYDDDGNVPSRPGSLLAQSAVVSLVPNGTTTATISGVNLTAGTTYWLATNTDDTTVARTYNGGNQASCFRSRTFGSMGDPFGGCFMDDNNYVVWLNYTVGSSASGSVSQAQLSLSTTGQAVFRNSEDSTTAFQVQNSAGTATLLNVDTLNGRIGIGKSTPAYKLDVAGGDINISGSRSLRFGGSQVLSANSDGSTVTLSNLNNGGTISAQADNFVLQDATATHQNFVINSSGGTTFSNKTNSATGFQIQNATGTTLLVADTSGMKISVTGTVATFASLTLANAHFASTQTNPPTIGTPASCGAAPTAAVTAGSTDTAGSFTITTGTGSTASTCGTTFTFNKPYGAAPKSIIVIGKTDAASAARQIYVSASDATTFTVSFGTSAAGANSTAYSFSYWVIE